MVPISWAVKEREPQVDESHRLVGSECLWAGLEHEVDLEPGDFLLIPPYMPHQEINPSANQTTIWLVVRSGQEPVVVNLRKACNGEYVAEDTDQSQSARTIEEMCHVQAD